MNSKTIWQEIHFSFALVSSSYSKFFWLSLFEKSQKHNLQNYFFKIEKLIKELLIYQSKGSNLNTIICKYVDIYIVNSYSMYLYTLL